MEHDSGLPEDLAASGGLSPGGDWEYVDGVAGEQEVTGVPQAGPPEAQAGTPVAQAGTPESQAGTPESQVDEAIAGLDGLPGRPLTEHVAVFEEAHAKLRQVLSDLDDGPADS